MENAADALKMAAAVLIFVLALSVSINAFGQARSTMNIVFQYKDREYDFTYVDDNGGKTTRTVSLETIVPSIYRAYKENYKIIFENMPFLYEKNIKQDDGTYQKVEINYLDLEKEVLAGDTQKEKFLKAILYGKYDIIENGVTITIEEYFSKLGIYINSQILQNAGLYGIILNNNHTFEEKLGIYYQEDLYGVEAGTTTTTESSTPEANKTKKRVITYIKQ